MNARYFKRLVDFEMIMNIINLCFANQDTAIDTEFVFNDKKYRIYREEGTKKIRFVRGEECALGISYRFGIRDKKNPNILINYDEIGLFFDDFINDAPEVQLWSEGFLTENKTAEDIGKNFDITIRGDWGHIYYHLNELDGGNIPVIDDNNSGALIFVKNGVLYGNYFIANNGKLYYKGDVVLPEEELACREKTSEKDPAVRYYVRDRLEFYRTEFQDFKKVIELRNRIVGSKMKSYLFTKEEMFMFYLQLYKVLVESKEDKKII